MGKVDFFVLLHRLKRQNMKRTLVLLFALLSCGISKAQLYNWEFGITLGGSNYVGDINSSFNSNENNAQWNQFEQSFDFYNTNFRLGILARYNLSPRWAFVGELNFTSLEGDDKHYGNPRNLNFYSPLRELSFVCEYNFFDYRTGSLQHRITPYIFAGIASFYFNPKTDIVNPITNELETVELQTLNTEGQGMKGYDKAYSRYGISIPFGLGVKFSIGSRICLGLQWGFRKTFTDYIDDISKTYVSQERLTEWAGELAAAAADRTHELDGMEGVYHADKLARGNSKTKDWYNFFGITITTKLSTKSSKCPGMK